MTKRKRKARPFVLNLPKVPNTREKWLNNLLMARLIEIVMKGNPK